nr:MAG TPA: repressor protein [Caudoviricetes sp.]
MTLHERLKDLKDKRNMLQKDIATALGISLRAYQYYERGEREPTASVLIAMSDYFGVSIDYLVGRTDNPEINK